MTENASRMTPSRDRWPIRLALLSIPILVMGVNALAVGFIDALSSVMIETPIQAQIDTLTGMPAVRFLNNTLPFILTIAVLAWYLSPVYRAFWNGSPARGTAGKAARRLLDAPTITAALTGAGWLTGVPIVIWAGKATGMDFQPGFYTEYLAHSLVLFGFSFIICYYGVEVTVRRALVGKLFKESEVLAIGSRYSLSIGARLAVFAVATAAVPGLMFLVAIGILNAGGDNHFGRDLLPILSWAVPIVSMLIAVITWLKALSIQAPITELREAARKIGEGKFDERVTVRSSDELGALGGAFNDMAHGLEERERMRGIFGRIVDPRVRDHLMERDASSQGEIRQATVVFFDLAGFTSISESLPAKRVVFLLNLYFDAVTACVEAEGGLVNKFIGDGVLAVFGVPSDLPDHAEHALLAIESLGSRMARMNARLTDKGYKALRFRAGVHTGEVLSGIVGSRNRQEYTVIGDAVNVASRLEPLGKAYGMDIIVSRATVGSLKKKRAMRPLGMAEIRGKRERLELFGL